MPSQVRKPDIDSIGAPNSTSSPNVFCNNLKLTRKGDKRTCGGTDVGVHNVYTNNRDHQVVGDSDSKGHTQIVGSPNVFVN